jgi:YfiH family protein
MILKYFRDIPLYQFDRFDRDKNIFHFITTRHGKSSLSPVPSFNIGYNSGCTEEKVTENRSELAKILNITADHLIFQKQIHSTHIEIINRPLENTREIPETDGMITIVPGICICVKGADCVPILFYDPVCNVCAVVHAGWKGTFQRIAEKMISKLINDFNCNPENIIAGIGPSAGPESYQVGEDVAGLFEKEFPSSKIIMKNKNNDLFLNLWECNKQQLTGSGLIESNIEISGFCTIKNNNLFYSYRSDKSDTGRFACGIMLK